MSRSSVTAFFLLAVASVPAVNTAHAQPKPPSAVPMQEWTVPWEKSRPRDPAVAPDGKVFFVGQVGNYIARLDPTTGDFKRYELDPGTLPHNCVVDARGMVWFSGNANGMIGRLDPATGAITKFPMPDPAVKDPHTLVFDKKGDIWFTAQNSNYIGHLAVGTGKIRLLKMPTAGAKPYGIALDSRGRPWFNLFGTSTLASVDPQTMEMKTYKLADERTRDRRIAITSDDKIWYADYSRGFLGKLDPVTSKVEEWQLPGGGMSLPYGMTVDDKDRLWVAETGVQPNRLVGFDPKTSSFFSMTNIASGGGVVRYMIFDKKSKLLWFGTDANTIGKAEVNGTVKVAM